MHYKTTIVLIIILGLVIGISWVYTTQRDSGDPDRVSVPRQFFYQVDDDEVEKVGVVYQGAEEIFVSDPNGGWRFENAEGEFIDMSRWGGITLLISGPQYRRVITERATDLARFGLEDPTIVITAGLEAIGEVEIRLGDRTPDGVAHYAQFQDQEKVYLVDAHWGDEFSKLVTNPPHIIYNEEGTPIPAVVPEPEF